MSGGRIPRQSSVWDESRNSSRVVPPPPDALPNALHALERLRIEDPRLARWILDGHPLLTHAEHYARFGVPYERPKRRER